ncbi:hypothetical protein B0H19DRAFT_1066779 [Mycena capillaripes]|nr:hypothetical protein B0H19DRAFT_1066779 [Mycena capillaripes]
MRMPASVNDGFLNQIVFSSGTLAASDIIAFGLQFASDTQQVKDVGGGCILCENEVQHIPAPPVLNELLTNGDCLNFRVRDMELRIKNNLQKLKLNGGIDDKQHVPLAVRHWLKDCEEWLLSHRNADVYTYQHIPYGQKLVSQAHGLQNRPTLAKSRSTAQQAHFICKKFRDNPRHSLPCREIDPAISQGGNKGQGVKVESKTPPKLNLQRLRSRDL